MLYQFKCVSLACSAVLLLSLPGRGQTISISSGVHTYSSLTDTVVTVGGPSELHLTSRNNPLIRSTVDLTSDDGWLFFSNLRPSSVATSFLRQIRVNGATAALDQNVRVTQYGAGSVVIPISGDAVPLVVYSGPHFQGEALEVEELIYFDPRRLGLLDNVISSFRLQRGYMATVAQNGDGTGISRVYVAQDADLEVAVLAEDLDDAISFVRVFPWRWTAKKGWAGGKEPLVSPLWHYDWDNVTTSSMDIEYVPMRHNLYWNAYANIDNKIGSTHALGFNEPDRPDQADMTVQQAIDQWPNLLRSGLRLGAPAPSDAGTALEWLYEFIDQADALNYRVDFVPVHFYKGGWTASQYYNWLLAIHQRTGRPLWVTEFNNGANWTCCEPTLESQAQTIGEFIEMLDNAPFVERYAIYNWVGPTRELVTGGTLNPSGEVYRDNASPLAYVQEVPAGGEKGLAQYGFEDNTRDASGYGNHGLPSRLASYVPGRSGKAIHLDGISDHVRLPPNIAHSSDFTFAAWVHWEGGNIWQRIFDFGRDTDHYMFLTPRSGGETLRFAMTTNGYGNEQRLETSALPIGRWTHVAITLKRNVGSLYVDGALRASSNEMLIDPKNIEPISNYLGRSQFATDPLFAGRMDEVIILDTALSGSQIAALMTNQPPIFSSDLLSGGVAFEGERFLGALGDHVNGEDGPGTLTFSKAGGPEWLTVAVNGTVSGTPSAEDLGQNLFTVRVQDIAGASGFAVYEVEVVTALDPPPRADIARMDDGIEVSWPQANVGWMLQANTNALDMNWFDVSESVSTNRHVAPATHGSHFFRLTRP